MPNKPIDKKTQKIIKKMADKGFTPNTIAEIVDHDRKTVKKYAEKEDE